MRDTPEHWRIGFMGSADFSLFVLNALLEHSFTPKVIYSQPAKARGRGMKPSPTVVGRLAQKHNIPLKTPEKFTDKDIEELKAEKLDVLIVVAYGLILPKEILDIPRLGCLNIHPSNLPRWRGAAPLQRAIHAGDRLGGVCIIQMDAGIDTGDILWQKSLDIDPDITAGEWHDHTGKIGAQGLIEILPKLTHTKPVKQRKQGITYAKMIDRAETQINFHQPSLQIKNHLRAFSPKPGAWCLWNNRRLRLYSAKIVRHDTVIERQIGEVCDHQLTIRSQDGYFIPQEVQLEGKQKMQTSAFLRGHPVIEGTILGGRKI